MGDDNGILYDDVDLVLIVRPLQSLICVKLW